VVYDQSWAPSEARRAYSLPPTSPKSSARSPAGPTTAGDKVTSTAVSLWTCQTLAPVTALMLYTPEP
jgi:hypothetical protein